jgi:large subunit ribosomal protein L35
MYVRPLDRGGLSHHFARTLACSGLPNVAPIVALRPARRARRGVIVPKMKTNKAAAKRFRVTGKGRVRRPKGGGNHGMQEKSRKRLRRLRKNDMVDSSMQKHVKRMLPYG